MPGAAKRNPRNTPRTNDVFLCPGAGPIGNPLRVRVTEVTPDKVVFFTALGGGQCSMDEWPELMADAKVIKRAA